MSEALESKDPPQSESIIEQSVVAQIMDAIVCTDRDFDMPVSQQELNRLESL